jgi:hypothetical protein
LALSNDDIWRLELKARLHAHNLRGEVEQRPGTSLGMEALDEAKIADAKAFEAIADLLMGLQGDWPAFASLVREGYKVEAARRELNKKVSEALPAPEVDEAAA